MPEEINQQRQQWEITLTRSTFMFVRRYYAYAMSLRKGHLSTYSTTTARNLLTALIDYYRAAPTKAEMQRRANYFGYSIPELQAAIDNLNRHGEVLAATGGADAHLKRITELVAGMRYEDSVKAKARAQARRFEHGRRRRQE